LDVDADHDKNEGDSLGSQIEPDAGIDDTDAKLPAMEDDKRWNLKLLLLNSLLQLKLVQNLKLLHR
jgi:hypothetical protein